MNKKIVIGIAVVAAIVIGGLLYQKYQPSDKLSNMDVSYGKISGTMQDLIAKNVPMHCTFKGTTDGSESSGDVYISGMRMKGDFVTMQDGKKVISHMVRAEDTTYMWSSDQPKGFKTTVSVDNAEVMKESAEYMSQGSQTIDPRTQKFDYDCKPWVVSESSFTPPGDVEFIDLDGMMKQMEGLQKKVVAPTGATGGSESEENSACAVCMQVPEGQAREQCKTAMNCK